MLRKMIDKVYMRYWDAYRCGHDKHVVSRYDSDFHVRNQIIHYGYIVTDNAPFF